MDGYPWLVARLHDGAVWHTVGHLGRVERQADGFYRHSWTSLCQRASSDTPTVYTGTEDPPTGHVCTWCRRRLGYQLAHLTESIERLDAMEGIPPST